jgi:hypothetical protein
LCTGRRGAIRTRGRSGARRRLRFASAPQEPDCQHPQRERASRKDHWLSTGKSFCICEELSRITLPQVATDVLDLLSTSIGKLSQSWLCAVLSKVLASLAERLSHTCDRLNDVLFSGI